MIDWSRVRRAVEVLAGRAAQEDRAPLGPQAPPLTVEAATERPAERAAVPVNELRGFKWD
jgi:hypothetical protein